MLGLMHGDGDTDRRPDPRHGPDWRDAWFRVYAELNDFVPPAQRGRQFRHRFRGTPSVKDCIEAMGVPHTEVDVILVDGASVGFDHLLRGGERVAVYPVFERLDVSPVQRLRPAPLRESRFVADVHLGTLARYLRLLGFDTAWNNAMDDSGIIELSLSERRIILTRDRGILRNGRVTHGYWLRNTDPLAQLREVVAALQLGASLRPYTRCMECNGRVQPLDRREVLGQVPLQVFLVYRDFSRCQGCRRVYWAGSHQGRLEAVIDAARQAAAGDDSPGTAQAPPGEPVSRSD